MLDSRTVLLLARWKSRRQLTSDYSAAKTLKIDPSTISGWRAHKSHAQADLAAKMAEECGLDVLRVLAAIEADRAKVGPVQRVWKRLGAGAFGALAVMVLWAGVAIPGQSNAANPSAQTMVTRHNCPFALTTMQKRRPRSRGLRAVFRLVIRLLWIQKTRLMAGFVVSTREVKQTFPNIIVRIGAHASPRSKPGR